MVIGPTLGGVLTGLFGWPAIFAVNIPLAALSLVLALLWVPKDGGYVQWLETTRQLSEEAAGLMQLPMSGTAVCAAAFSGRASGIRARLVTVAVALIGGSAWLLLVHDGTWVGALLALAALFGLAQGLTSVANQTTLYREAPAEQMRTASGLFRTAQYLGAIVASTLIALCFGSHADSASLHRLAIALVVVSGLLLAVTVSDRGLRAGKA
jgi:MFS family permease